jgi:hypothetical protein
MNWCLFRYTLLLVVNLGCLFAWGTVGFQTADDATMCLTASGFWSGEGHPALVFSHVWIGDALVTLYSRWPTPNWYVLLQMLLTCTGVLVIWPRVVPRVERSVFQEMLLAQGIFTVVFAEAFLWPQYTVTAFLVGWAGWLLWLRPARVGHAWAGLGLLIGAAMLRMPAFWALWVVACPLVVWPLVRTSFSLKIKQLALPALLALALQVADQWAYATRWHAADVAAYEVALDAIANGPNTLADTDSMALPYDRESLRLLHAWWPVDEAIFSKQKTIEAGQSVRRMRTPTEAFDYLLSALRADWHSVLLLLALALACGVERRNSPFFIEKMLFLIIVGLLVLGLAGVSRLPHRVVFPLGWVAMLGSFYFFEIKNAPTWRWWCLLPAAGLALANLRAKSLHNATERSAWQVRLATMSAHPDCIFVLDPAVAVGSWSWRNPALHAPHRVLPVGWLSATPAQQAVRVRLGAGPLHEQATRYTFVAPPRAALSAFFQKKYPVEVTWHALERDDFWKMNILYKLPIR